MSDFSIFKHVDVSVSVCIGDVTISAEQLLNLKVGHTFKLNQPVDTPVVLKFQDKIIGLGQLVAIDGYYGVEITEIKPMVP